MPHRHRPLRERALRRAGARLDKRRMSYLHEWQSMQCLASQPGCLTEMWRHPGKNWQRRAESTLAAFAGPSWQDAALDRALWNARRPAFVQ